MSVLNDFSLLFFLKIERVSEIACKDMILFQAKMLFLKCLGGNPKKKVYIDGSSG